MSGAGGAPLPGPDDPAGRDSPEERHARRLSALAIAWGVVTLVFLAWFAKHWKV